MILQTIKRSAGSSGRVGESLGKLGSLGPESDIGRDDVH